MRSKAFLLAGCIIHCAFGNWNAAYCRTTIPEDAGMPETQYSRAVTEEMLIFELPGTMHGRWNLGNA